VRAALAYPSPLETIKFGFPYLSWLPVMIGGYLITRYLNANREQFTRITLSIGVGLMAAWGIITLINDFGVLYHDHPLVVTKHPPTLDYLTLYLGIVFLLLAFFHRFTVLQDVWFGRLFSILGQTALFFYVIHIYALIGAKEIIGPFVPLEGFALAVFYVAITLPPLFVLCYFYRALRKAHPNSVLQYL
jgi:surface polysaccharide O-acyltransferase-like enzyme